MADLTDSERVDAYLLKHPQWQGQLMAAREVLQATALVESIKWGGPAWSLEGRVLIGLAAYKKHCAVWFHHGVFLKDLAQRLMTAQESTRGMRQWRMLEGERLDVSLFRRYVKETIANERAGRRLKPRAAVQAEALTQPEELPEELAVLLRADQSLEAAFAGLTPGRAREFAQHVATAKRAATRVSRAEKVVPLIRAGVGLHDKYRSR